MTPTPAPQPPVGRRSSWPATLVTLGAALTLLMSIGVFVPPFAFVLAVGFGLVAGLFGLHYLVWGRWLRGMAEREEAEETLDR